MDVTITVRVCDICKRRDRNATRYTLTPDEGEPRQRDLCDEDAAAVLAVFVEDVEKVSEDDSADSSAPQEPAAKKAPAKKAVAKKATRRPRRTPVRTMEEIEAEKKAKAEQS
ncbi:hypothetical protein OG824_18610 [Streptomyces prunicolor]|uniref:hypothetical protein n=1 Tax=Streptomyces prunicolor TaxID=67348 RepID=UPI00224D1851|nr:hypothetical protein [Streptomyces prunicolor]MCX5237214.1 hypothetical protein [Streptomyces prunicolor]